MHDVVVVGAGPAGSTVAADLAGRLTAPEGWTAEALRAVSRGLDGPGEAARCFSCGSCTQCDTCLLYCPEGIIRRDGPGYRIDGEQCKGCGICVAECPRRAMEMAADAAVR